MAARWQEGCGEGEGGLGRWAGEAASRWRGAMWGAGHGSARLPWHRLLLASPAAFEGLVP